jgi:hypothetical protein
MPGSIATDRPADSPVEVRFTDRWRRMSLGGTRLHWPPPPSAGNTDLTPTFDPNEGDHAHHEAS